MNINAENYYHAEVKNGCYSQYELFHNYFIATNSKFRIFKSNQDMEILAIRHA